MARAVAGTTPVLVGVGQAVERISASDYRALSPADLAAEAASAALKDSSIDAGILRNLIEVVGAIRTFEDSTPAPAAFGKPDKFPLAVARRLGLHPEIAILEKAGGQSPLALLTTLGSHIASGKVEAALAFGSEAISSVRDLLAKGETRDWAETDLGPMEDHGRGVAGFMNRYLLAHGLAGAAPAYGLLENARRARLGLTREQYRGEMARLFAPFSAVAASNPWSSADIAAISADEIMEVSERNRMIADPYPLRMVSRDQVNQAAAVLMMSVDAARRLGVPESRWIYIHGWSLAEERDILNRPDLGASPAAVATLEAALAQSGNTVGEIDHFDFYSCFPVAVFAAAIDGLGLKPDDPRGLSVTGGLPYFGGPGNNYSMHAFATMAERLRERPGSVGLVGVNGGFLSKYGAAILSTEHAAWQELAGNPVQCLLDAQPAPAIERLPDGEARVLTYTVIYKKGVPDLGVIVGTLANGARFFANNADATTLAMMIEADSIGRTIWVVSTGGHNRFAFDAATLAVACIPPTPSFSDAYETIRLKRDGHVIEITIDRPDRRNTIDTVAQVELSGVFDAFEADDALWVAILTGAGDRIFCAGADLKASRDVPPLAGGWCGLTARRRTKPIIAAVNGSALGGGFELALACDLIVADPTARFALPEVKRGVVAAAGGAVRLPRQLPRKIAMELLLTGREMTVEEAERHGLVNCVSEPGDVLVAARALAETIVSASPTSCRATLALVDEGDEYPDVATSAERSFHSLSVDRVVFSDDMQEGIRAFIEKRTPNWVNR